MNVESENTNLDPDEIQRFNDVGADWWKPDGPFHALHVLNPVRLRYIRSGCRLEDSAVLDLGCGGGLLCEAMAVCGARVTGVDASGTAIATARSHATGSALDIDYRLAGVKEFAVAETRKYDLVTCMELIEHVPEPDSLIATCASLLRPGGDLFLSTINRTAQAFLAAIIGAEYLFRLIPKGTHDYARFVRPAELDAWLRDAGFETLDVAGVEYLPWLDHCRISNRLSVNYLLHARLR